ncbi:MAG TPA: HAD family hydrolase [Candidatus Saccharimonadales bacterium]
MIKALLFDADGVLLYHTDKLFSERLADELGINSSEIEEFFAGPFQDCLVGKLDIKQAIAPYAKQWGWGKTIDDLLRFWFDYEHRENAQLLERIQGYRLRGIRCYVATNNEKYRAEGTFMKINISGSFDGLFASGLLGVIKPDKAFFARVLSSLRGVNRDEVLFWDDSDKNVAAAREFGFSAELYTTFPKFEQRMEHYGFS